MTYHHFVDLFVQSTNFQPNCIEFAVDFLDSKCTFASSQKFRFENVNSRFRFSAALDPGWGVTFLINITGGGGGGGGRGSDTKKVFTWSGNSN